MVGGGGIGACFASGDKVPFIGIAAEDKEVLLTRDSVV